MKYSGRTHVGTIRENNEDTFLFPENARVEVDQGKLEKLGHLLILCDGMGGANAGEVASEKTAQWLMERYYQTNEPVDENGLALLLEDVNQDVLQYSREHPECRGMGTTCVALLHREAWVYLVSCGDSRIYRLKGERLFQCTEDHTETWIQYRRGRITKDQIRTHPMNHLLNSAIGIQRDPRIDGCSLDAEGLFLMCSDGLTDLVPEEEIREILLRGVSLEERCDALIDAALELGGKDNVTVILCQCDR